MISLILTSLLKFQDGQRWAKFCERHLIADDPYQYEQLSVDQLVNLRIKYYNERHKSQVLENEIIKRLQYEPLTFEQQERLLIVLRLKL
jgi:hypothetical protein